MKLYKTLIRPVVCYAAETLTLSKADSYRLMIFEGKIIRKIHRTVNEEGRWKIENNIETEQILENEKIVKFIVRRDQMVGTCGKNERGNNAKKHNVSKYRRNQKKKTTKEQMDR